MRHCEKYVPTDDEFITDFLEDVIEENEMNVCGARVLLNELAKAKPMFRMLKHAYYKLSPLYEILDLIGISPF